MTELTLFPGPRLSFRYSDGTVADVTDRAHEFLFESMRLADGVTLRDLFGLLVASPVLVSVFRRDYAQELLAHVQGAAPAGPAPEYSPTALEYLELYRTWQYHSRAASLAPLGVANLHGVGFELQDDHDMGGFVQAKGTRIEWSISMTDVRKLLALPLRFKSQVSVCEADYHAKASGRVIKELALDGYTLSEVLHSTLWSLSFYGTPQEQAEVSDELQARYAECLAGEEGETHSIEDLFGPMDAASVEALFEATGTVPVGRVSFFLRELEDDEPIQAGLDRLRDAEGSPRDLQVRPEYRDLDAYAFRVLFSKARDRKSG